MNTHYSWNKLVLRSHLVADDCICAYEASPFCEQIAREAREAIRKAGEAGEVSMKNWT